MYYMVLSLYVLLVEKMIIKIRHIIIQMMNYNNLINMMIICSMLYINNYFIIDIFNYYIESIDISKMIIKKKST